MADIIAVAVLGIHNQSISVKSHLSTTVSCVSVNSSLNEEGIK